MKWTLGPRGRGLGGLPGRGGGGSALRALSLALHTYASVKVLCFPPL